MDSPLLLVWTVYIYTFESSIFDQDTEMKMTVPSGSTSATLDSDLANNRLLWTWLLQIKNLTQKIVTKAFIKTSRE